MISWDYIEGPVGACLLTGFGKRIWVFGDRHVLSYACSMSKGLEGKRIGRLEHVIADLAPFMEKREETLDVLIETAPFELEPGVAAKVYHPVDTYMDSLNVFLGMCHLKGACPYPNLRVHASDFRKHIPELNSLLGVATRASSALFNEMTEMTEEYVPWTEFPEDVVERIYNVLSDDDIAQITDFLDGFKHFNTVSEVFDQLIEMVGLANIIDNIADESHKQALIDYLLEKCQGVGPDASGFFAMKLQDVLKSHRNTVYFLCQMMEEADWIMEVPLVASLLSGDVKNAIVSCGFVHARRIVAQLENFGFTLEFEHEDLDAQCMEWPGTDPLF